MIPDLQVNTTPVSGPLQLVTCGVSSELSRSDAPTGLPAVKSNYSGLL